MSINFSLIFLKYFLIGTDARIRTSIDCFGDSSPAVRRRRYEWREDVDSNHDRSVNSRLYWPLYYQPIMCFSVVLFVGPKKHKQPLYDIGCRLVCSANALKFIRRRGCSTCLLVFLLAVPETCEHLMCNSNFTRLLDSETFNSLSMGTSR